MRNEMRAFTVIEMLVAMLLFSILASASLYSYLNVQKYFIAMHHAQQISEKAWQLNTLLYKDFESSDLIYYDKNKIILLFHESKYVSYLFGHKSTIRESSEMKDTFPIVAYEIKVEFIKSDVPTSKLPLRSFNCKLNLNGLSIDYSLHKEYDAKTTMIKPVE